MKVVIFGSDKYLLTLMPTFARFFHEYWPDCPWPVEVVSQTVTVSEFPTVCTGPDENFSQQVLRYVEMEPGDEPFLMLLDDYFLTEPVNTEVVEHAYQVMLDDPQVAHVNLWIIGDDVWRWEYSDHLGEFDKSRCNWLFQNQAGIWRPRLLRDIAQPDENGWHMETRGSSRARSYPGRFLTVYENAISYTNYMGRAAPRQEGIDWLIENGMEPIYPPQEGGTSD